MCGTDKVISVEVDLTGACTIGEINRRITAASFKRIAEIKREERLEAMRQEHERIRELEEVRKIKEGLGINNVKIVAGDTVTLRDGSWSTIIEKGDNKLSSITGIAMNRVLYKVIDLNCVLPSKGIWESVPTERKNNIILMDNSGRIVFTNVRFCEKVCF